MSPQDARDHNPEASSAPTRQWSLTFAHMAVKMAVNSVVTPVVDRGHFPQALRILALELPSARADAAPKATGIYPKDDDR